MALLSTFDNFKICFGIRIYIFFLDFIAPYRCFLCCSMWDGCDGIIGRDEMEQLFSYNWIQR